VGTPQEIVASPADDYVRAFTKEVDRGRVFTAATAMDEAEALDLATDTPQTALKRMEAAQRDGLLVTDAGRVVGVVTYQDLARAMRNNGADIASIMRRDYPTARPDDHLAAVYQRCSAGLPVAVTGRDGRLRGVLDPVRLFDMLSSDKPEAPASGE
jgi:glycine betaine/proline transport system ATP-binding protein